LTTHVPWDLVRPRAVRPAASRLLGRGRLVRGRRRAGALFSVPGGGRRHALAELVCPAGWLLSFSMPMRGDQAEGSSNEGGGRTCMERGAPAQSHHGNTLPGRVSVVGRRERLGSSGRAGRPTSSSECIPDDLAKPRTASALDLPYSSQPAGMEPTAFGPKPRQVAGGPSDGRFLGRHAREPGLVGSMTEEAEKQGRRGR